MTNPNMGKTTAQLNPNRQYVIGTAGHIDHGKTALVKALTGFDTDNLPEEKARGITVNIGFAHMSGNVTIIDVPGHERLIKNMVAGVSTIDLVLFVIAADDGIMPQTREHLDIVKLLGIQHGIFVITKSDLADKEWIALVKQDIRNLLTDTPFKDAMIVTTSVTTGEGIEELSKLLIQQLSKIPPKQDFEIFREPVDRVFNLKGFGTVITGTVLGGSLRIGDPVEIQPSRIRTKARTLQTHDSEVKEVRAGFRAAINLAGVELNEVERGHVLVQPDLYHPIETINARLTILKFSPKPLKTNQRIRFHIHTAEALARIIISDRSELKPGDSTFVQLRLETPVHAAYQDRFIIRQYSPQITIGGGIVLQTNPTRFRKKHLPGFQRTLQSLENSDPREKILASFDDQLHQPLSLNRVKVSTNISFAELHRMIDELMSGKEIFAQKVGSETLYYSVGQVEPVLEKLISELKKYHQSFPNRSGISERELISKFEKLFSPELLRLSIRRGLEQNKIRMEKQEISLADFQPQFSSKEAKLLEQINQHYLQSKSTPPTWKEVLEIFGVSEKELKELQILLRNQGELVFVDETLAFHKSALDEIQKKIKLFFEKKSEMSVGEFKEMTGTTRKHAIPLLAYFDGKGITERDGDVRRAGSKS